MSITVGQIQINMFDPLKLATCADILAVSGRPANQVHASATKAAGRLLTRH